MFRMNETWRTHDLAFASAASNEGHSLEHVKREWLITNGAGSYAMGTVPGINTRRYHGMLIAALRPPVRRIVALHQVLEEVLLPATNKSPARTVELSSFLFRSPDGPPVHHPQGHLRLARFERSTSVRWTYELPGTGLCVSRELHLHWKKQAATLRYTFLKSSTQTTVATPSGLSIRLTPMLSLRDFHSVSHPGGWYQLHEDQHDTLRVALSDATVTLRCQSESEIVSPAWFHKHDNWWHNFYYPCDNERGQEDHESWLAPGHFDLSISSLDRKAKEATNAGSPLATLALTVALGSAVDAAPDNDAPRSAHLQPLRQAIADAVPARAASPRAVTALTLAADDFVVDRRVRQQQLSTILAGYPWFYDWGRDTFIALPGLLLVPRRFDEARAVLRVFADNLRDGLVANRFDDYDDAAAHYNTVDASLWFIHAAVQYVKASGDVASWNTWLGSACSTIALAYEAGTGDWLAGAEGRPLIRADHDGLITAGNNTTQLTWMDAACNGVVFTPRPGKAVEINALWHHVLVALSQELAQLQPVHAARFDKLAARVKRNFATVFWDAERSMLIDHVWADDQGNTHNDHAIRPNQIFAASLEHSPLPMDKRQAVVAAVTEHLLTPVGLRTLPPSDPAYHAHYQGPQHQRDEAYHQGTIWPWLIGPYAEAVLRTGSPRATARRKAAAAISPLIEVMLSSGIGQLHEIHEAQAPHRPVGCTAQAWSIAEVLRVAALIGRD